MDSLHEQPSEALNGVAFDQLAEDGISAHPENENNWESWAMSAAGAFFGAPYLESGTAHAAWAGFVHNLRSRLIR